MRAYCSTALAGWFGPRVQVPQRVGGIPVARLIVSDAHVFRDGGIEPSLTKQLFRLFQRVFAIKRHRITPGAVTLWAANASILSNSVGGRNERRCTAE